MAASLTFSRLLASPTTPHYLSSTALFPPKSLSSKLPLSPFSLKFNHSKPFKPCTFHTPSYATKSTTISATIAVGDKLPEATFSYLDDAGEVQTTTISDLTKGKKAILFAVPGAFTPTCSQKHVPGFVEKSAELKAKGVDTIACISVNDAFVMKAWKKDLKVNDEVLLLSDGNGTFTKAIGCELDLSDKPVGLGVRSRRDRWLKFDELGKEILSIALPAALALAADPLTSLIDTAFVGHIGPAELAAVGVSTFVFNLVSKIFNIPLLNITTSFVAEEQALISKDSSQTDESNFGGKYQSKRRIPSVSTSLAVAATLGIAETVLLSLGSGIIMNIMGIPADSPMRRPAENFLMLRAFGAPAIVIALAAQGTFRGFKDTKTPLYAVGAGNVLNAILDPILIFFFGLGISGAAATTVISDYLKSGGLLIGRTVAVFLTLTLSISMAAKQGPIPMAGHQICMQVWLPISLLTDALALAGQTLLASSYSQGNYEQARLITYRVLQIGLGTGITLSVILFFGFGSFSSLFTTDLEVLSVARSGILFVAGTQPVNALAFVIDGLYYGVSDYGYAAYSTMLVGLVSSMFLLVAAPELGLPGVWAGLFLFMTMRVLAGAWRLSSKNGPWSMIWYKDGGGD